MKTNETLQWSLEIQTSLQPFVALWAPPGKDPEDTHNHNTKHVLNECDNTMVQIEWQQWELTP